MQLLYKNFLIKRYHCCCYSLIPFSSITKRSFSATTTNNNNNNDTKNNDNNDDIVKIGFFGLGNMGLPMAINLTKNKSNHVFAFDLNNKNTAALLEQQAQTNNNKNNVTIADSVESVAREANIIITMLPGCNAVNSVLSKCLSSIQQQQQKQNNDQKDTPPPSIPRTLFIDCSTVSPTTSRYWHSQLIQQQHDMVDAPVSGGVKGAQNATLTFMVGSLSDQNTNIVTPILEQMGKRIIPCGGSGSGAATKLCNNLALAAQMVGICEAMNLGEKLGVDPIVLSNVMNTSTAKCWSSEVNNPHAKVAAQTGSPASNNYEGGFGTKLMLKDLGLAIAAGAEADIALPIGTATKELYKMADLHGLGDKDFGVILEFLRREK